MGAFSEVAASGFWHPAMAGCISHGDRLLRYCNTVLPNGAHVWYKADDGLWWLGKISTTTPTDGVYSVRFLNDPRG